MKENSILRAVREGRPALGTGLKEFASRGVPWIIEASGFDYCMIDHEHGAFDLETIADLAGWFQATDVSAIVRIHKSFTHLIPAILDQGIMGVQVSEVDSVEEARAIVAQAKYPPIGNRGISGQGMHTGYRSYGGRAPDRGGLQRARQTGPRVGGNRGADRGVLAARLQGAEPARHRRQHLSRWPEGACRSRPGAAEVDRCAGALRRAMS